MEEIDTNVHYNIATLHTGKRFQKNKEYIVDNTSHMQQFQRELAVVRVKKGKYSISTEILNNERKDVKACLIIGLLIYVKPDFSQESNSEIW